MKYLMGIVTILLMLVGMVESGFAQDGTRPYLGVRIADTDTGVQIQGVLPDSPADVSGLKVGDVVVSFEGEPIQSSEQLVDLVAQHAPGDQVAIAVERDGQVMDFTVALSTQQPTVEIQIGEPGTSPPPRPGRPDRGRLNFPPFLSAERYQLGVQFESLTPEIAAREELAADEGALITEVVSDSPAEDAGLKVGDIITAVDGDAVDIEHTLSDRLFAYEAQDQIMLDILRDGETIQLSAVLAAEHPARRIFSMQFPEIGVPGIDNGGTGIHSNPEGLPGTLEFDFEIPFEISQSPPTEVPEGQQVFECAHGDISIYVTVPDRVPGMIGCTPYNP